MGPVRETGNRFRRIYCLELEFLVPGVVFRFNDATSLALFSREPLGVNDVDSQEGSRY
jgi:hypothetical protein